MRVDIHPNFLTRAECDELNCWVDAAVANGQIGLGSTSAMGSLGVDPTRYTSRGSGSKFVYPQLVRDLSDKIRKFVGVDIYPRISDHGRDGVVVSRTSEGPGVYPHVDSPMPPYGAWPALRCNVMTRAPERGGVLDIDGTKFPQIGVGDLHCYLVSVYTHSVGPVFGPVSRVLWMFGAYVPPDFWE